MKKHLVLAALLFSTAIAFSQSKEIKKAERAIDKGDTTEALAQIKAAEALIGSADKDDKTKFYLTKGKIYLAAAGKTGHDQMKEAANAYMKAMEFEPTGKMAEELANGCQNLRVALVNSAIEDQGRQNYARASEKLYMSYMTNPKDTSDLYYAAGNAVNGKDYNTALDYYKKLLDMGYTGIKKEYTALNVETGETEVFYDEAERKQALILQKGTYTNPSERLSESVQGDILQKVTLIYISQGKNDEAQALMDEARKANPTDVGLMRADADLAYKKGDMKRYDALMNEIVKTDPNNPEIYYNLGVSAGQIGEKEKAMGYYKKALELKPNYAFAHINIAALMLSEEQSIVDEMNGLGNSSADNKRYDELKAKREGLYQGALPHLEAAVKEKSDNIELVRTLKNIYSQLGMDDKYKEAKATLEAMEGGK